MPSRLANANEILQEELAQCKKDTEKLYGEWHRFESIAEYAPLGLALIDKDGNFCYTNPRFREMFGYDPAEISKGRDWFRKAYPDPTYRHNAISAWIDLGTCHVGFFSLALMVKVPVGVGQSMLPRPTENASASLPSLK